MTLQTYGLYRSMNTYIQFFKIWTIMSGFLSIFLIGIPFLIAGVYISNRLKLAQQDLERSLCFYGVPDDIRFYLDNNKIVADGFGNLIKNKYLLFACDLRKKYNITSIPALSHEEWMYYCEAFHRSLGMHIITNPQEQTVSPEAMYATVHKPISNDFLYNITLEKEQLKDEMEFQIRNGKVNRSQYEETKNQQKKDQELYWDQVEQQRFQQQFFQDQQFRNN